MVKKAFGYTAVQNAHLRNAPKTGQNGPGQAKIEEGTATILKPAL